MSPLPQYHLLHDNPTSSPAICPTLDAYHSFQRNRRLYIQRTSYSTDPKRLIIDNKALHGPSALHAFYERNENLGLSCSSLHHNPQF